MSSILCINMHSFSSLLLCSNSRTAKTGTCLWDPNTKKNIPGVLIPSVWSQVWMWPASRNGSGRSGYSEWHLQRLGKWGLVSLPQALSWASGTVCPWAYTSSSVQDSGLGAFTESPPKFFAEYLKRSLNVSEVTLLVNGRMHLNLGLNNTEEKNKDSPA